MRPTQVVGVERLAGDVEGRALVGHAPRPTTGSSGRRLESLGLHRMLDVRSRTCCTVGVSHAVSSANSFSSNCTEHRRAVARAGPVVVDRGALGGQHLGGRADGLLRSRACRLEGGLGGQRPDRRGRHSAEPDPGLRTTAVGRRAHVEREADRHARDVVEAAAWRSCGTRSAPPAGSGTTTSAISSLGRRTVCAVAGEVVGQRHRPLRHLRPSIEASTSGGLEREQHRRGVTDRRAGAEVAAERRAVADQPARRTAGTARPAAAAGRRAGARSR